MGYGGALGTYAARCNQATYTAASNQVCGGNMNWRTTNLVVLGR